MGLLDLASSASAWRGYEYYKDGSVLLKKKITDHEYSGALRGSGNKHYEVFIDIEHPRKPISTVLTPMANGLFASIRLHCIFLFFRKRRISTTKKLLNMRRKKNGGKKNLIKRLSLTSTVFPKKNCGKPCMKFSMTAQIGCLKDL